MSMHARITWLFLRRIFALCAPCDMKDSKSKVLTRIAHWCSDTVL